MNRQRTPLQPDDYIEPRCVLCGDPYGAEPKTKPIPQQRIIEKMDEYMSRRDYSGAERHLKFWLEEARLGRDLRGQLMIENELVGHYRKTQERDKAFAHAAEALWLLDALDFNGTVSSGTTYINVATAYQAFGRNEEALALFEKARAVYESAPSVRPELLGGLYNNMALSCVEAGRFAQADDLYQKAMQVMDQVPGGVLEQAITCLNMADALAVQHGMEQAESAICDLLDRALALLDTPDVAHDGYYAFVCEKCAPSFSYYGYFLAAEDLSRRAEAIYAGN